MLDLFRPPQIVPSKVFQVVFDILVSNSALFLASCCSFLLTVVTIFDVYLLSFSSGGSTFNSSKISSFPLWPKTYPDGKLYGFETDIRAGHHILMPLNATYDNVTKDLRRTLATRSRASSSVWQCVLYRRGQRSRTFFIRFEPVTLQTSRGNYLSLYLVMSMH